MKGLLLAAVLAAPASAGVARAPVGLVPAVNVAAVAPLPSWLSVPVASDRVFIAQVLDAAKASPTAMAVLAKMEKAAVVRGRPLVVEIVKMTEAGTYNYDWGVLSLRRSDVEHGPRSNVQTLIHEMTHRLQADMPLPSDLLETELDSYITDFKIGRELGEKPSRGTWDWKAQRAYKRGLEPFLDYLQKQYPENAPLRGTRSKDYAARLRRELDASREELAAVRKERAERARVLEEMRRLGHPERETRAYAEDSVAPVDAVIATMERAIAWAEHDLGVFASPEKLAFARRYARAAVRRARAFQKIFARD